MRRERALLSFRGWEIPSVGLEDCIRAHHPRMRPGLFRPRGYCPRHPPKRHDNIVITVINEKVPNAARGLAGATSTRASAWVGEGLDVDGSFANGLKRH